MKVRVVAYKGKIVIVPSEPEKDIDDGWYPTGRGRVGCVLIDTAKRLGVSPEAIELLTKVQHNPVAIGDISWWSFEDGVHAISWYGPVHRVLDPESASAALGFQVWREHCTVIPNVVPEAAKQAIDANPNTYAWAEPHGIQ